jgi:hypothetical protein
MKKRSEEGKRELHGSSMGHSGGSKKPGMHKEGRTSGGFVTGHEEHVGHGQFANLPQQTVMKSYPVSRQDMGGKLDDTMDDIDSIQDFAEGQRSKYASYQK